MRVVIAPVLVGTRICRVVAPLQSLLEVEEWAGEWWEPSNVTLSEASLAPSAPDALLAEREVPLDDRRTTEARLNLAEIEALIRTGDPSRPENARFDDEVVARALPARRRLYPGNARFRRSGDVAADGDQHAPERRKSESKDATTPRRRASDHSPRAISDEASSQTDTKPPTRA